MKRLPLVLLLGALAALGLPRAAEAQADPHRDDWLNARWVVEGGLVMLRTEQQVKAEIGGETTGQLVNDVQFASALFVTAEVWRFVRLGVFLQIDAGRRSSARFEGLDENGDAVALSIGGGPYSEVWAGPLLQLRWRYLFGEMGWGAFAVRRDEARTDLPAVDGSTDGLFRASPRVAWMFGAGGYFPIYGDWDLMLRVTYRIRYYETRGGESLTQGVAFGHQNVTPFVGIAWRRE